MTLVNTSKQLINLELKPKAIINKIEKEKKKRVPPVR
jgi:hypothetical protein